MKLKNYIFRCIYNYPSLYYKKTWEDTKRSILGHVFLTIGTGIDFVEKGGHFASDIKYNYKKILPKGYSKRIKNLEKIAIIYNRDSADKKNYVAFGLIHSQYNSREKILFLKDFLLLNEKYLINGKTKETNLNLDEYKVIDIYPEDENNEWHPYPFSLEYTPFWDEKKKCFIPKELITRDWREGIVWIYKETKKWFEDDNKFLNDRYFNWGNFEDLKDYPNRPNHFLQNWNKHKDKLKVCDDYGIPRKLYNNPKDMAIDICRLSRIKYIENCQKIIDFYK